MPVLQSPKDKGRQVRVDESETSRLQILKEGGWYEVEQDRGGNWVAATPAAQEAAAEKGVDLSTVAGTGAKGRITKADVDAAAKPAGDEG